MGDFLNERVWSLLMKSLGLGAALAIMSAMAPPVFTMTKPQWDAYATAESSERTRWEVRQTTSFGVGVVVAVRGRVTAERPMPIGLAPSWSRTREAPAPHDQTPFGFVADMASGWPMRCLSSSHFGTNPIDNQGRVSKTVWTTSWGIPIGRSWDPQLMPPRTIPLRPLPLGLLVTTLAWSPVGFVLIVGVRHVRTRRRKRRGLCIICGYAIVGVTRCPECGVPVE